MSDSNKITLKVTTSNSNNDVLLTKVASILEYNEEKKKNIIVFDNNIKIIFGKYYVNINLSKTSISINIKGNTSLRITKAQCDYTIDEVEQDLLDAIECYSKFVNNEDNELDELLATYINCNKTQADIIDNLLRNILSTNGNTAQMEQLVADYYNNSENENQGGSQGGSQSGLQEESQWGQVGYDQNALDYAVGNIYTMPLVYTNRNPLIIQTVGTATFEIVYIDTTADHTDQYKMKIRINSVEITNPIEIDGVTTVNYSEEIVNRCFWTQDTCLTADVDMFSTIPGFVVGEDGVDAFLHMQGEGSDTYYPELSYDFGVTNYAIRKTSNNMNQFIVYQVPITPVTPVAPSLYITKNGGGSASITANGNTVENGTSVESGTIVNITVWPANGYTPTAEINAMSVNLTEGTGTYYGTFEMPNTDTTLVIYTGTVVDGGDTN